MCAEFKIVRNCPNSMSGCCNDVDKQLHVLGPTTKTLLSSSSSNKGADSGDQTISHSESIVLSLCSRDSEDVGVRGAYIFR